MFLPPCLPPPQKKTLLTVTELFTNKDYSQEQKLPKETPKPKHAQKHIGL